MSKQHFILNLTMGLIASGSTLTGANLARMLNANGYRTNYNKAYSLNRGVYRLISSCHAHFARQGRHCDAQAIASAFTNSKGHFAYH